MAGISPSAVRSIMAAGAAPPLPKIAGLGDSITAQGFGGTLAGGYIFSAAGYMTWATALSGQRVKLAPEGNFGIAGQRTDQMLARIGDVVRYGPSVCCVLAGTNDISTMTAAQTIANLDAMYNILYRAGIAIIAILIPHRGGLDATQYGKIHQVNEWIRAQRYKRLGFFVVDTGLTYGDPLTGAPRTNMSGDAMHPNVYGAYAIGAEVAKVLSSIFPLAPLPFSNIADVYHATNNPSGNLLDTAGMLGGTSGSKTNTGSPGVLPTGNLATGLSANGANIPTGVTLAFAKVTKEDGREFQQSTYGGSHSNTNPGSLNMQFASVHAKASAGDIVEAMAVVEVDAGATYLVPPQLILDIAWSGGTAFPTDMAGNNDFIMPPVAHTMVLRTPPFQLPATPTTLRPILRQTFTDAVGTVNVAGVIRYGSVSLRKVA